MANSPDPASRRKLQQPAAVVSRTDESQIVREQLLAVYERLLEALGPRHWWPAQSAEEVVVGAILVQNVSWRNVETAIHRLTQAGLLSFRAIHLAPVESIESLITSTRYYRTKAKKLKAFAEHLQHVHNGKLDSLLAQPLDLQRRELLAIYGIGRETADDILLYAAGLPSFVIDAYTKRIFARLGQTDEAVDYETMRAWFMNHLPHEVKLFNEYHALLDAVGHRFCHNRQPECGACPLNDTCRFPGGEAGPENARA